MLGILPQRREGTGDGVVDTCFPVATPAFASGHCQRTLPVGSSREAGRWVGTS